MQNKVLLRIVMVYLGVCIFYAISIAVEMPFGVHFQSDEVRDYSANQIDTLRSILGFNAINPHKDNMTNFGSSMESFSSDSLKSYPWVDDQDYWKWSHSVYAKMRAADNNSEVGFKYKYSGAGANTVDNWYRIPPVDTIVLDGLSFGCDKDYQAGGTGHINYNPQLFMKINRTLGDSGQIAGYLNVYWGNFWGNLYRGLLASYPVYVDSFSSGLARWYSWNNFFTDEYPDGENMLTFQLESAGVCTLWVDTLKIYDFYGKRLIEEGYYDAQILASVDTSTHGWVSNSVSAWYINDEPPYGNFLPVRYVDSLITSHYGIPGTVVYNAGVAAINMYLDECHPYGFCYDDFLKLTGIQTPWIDIYPFNGGQNGFDSTLLSGSDFRQISGFDCKYSLGLQRALSDMTNNFDTIITSLDRFDPPRKWYDMPQAMEWKAYNCNQGGETWARMPTQSEYSCAVFLSLCYGASGLIDYKWDGYCSPGNTLDNGHTFGFVDPVNWEKQRIWYCQRDRVNPYIKAIDDIYLGLTWEKAYPIYPDSITPPGGAWVSSITATSTTTDPNPDLGWFHVGEYRGNGNDHYIMLVNRACSQGPYDTTEAPPVTATLRLNSDNLNLGSYVYVIDLANGTNSADWAGHQDTTYTSLMPDNTIPYTITLRAGEGKLIKIAKTGRHGRGKQ